MKRRLQKRWHSGQFFMAENCQTTDVGFSPAKNMALAPEKRRSRNGRMISKRAWKTTRAMPQVSEKAMRIGLETERTVFDLEDQMIEKDLRRDLQSFSRQSMSYCKCIDTIHLAPTIFSELKHSTGKCHAIRQFSRAFFWDASARNLSQGFRSVEKSWATRTIF